MSTKVAAGASLDGLTMGACKGGGGFSISDLICNLEQMNVEEDVCEKVFEGFENFQNISDGIRQHSAIIKKLYKKAGNDQVEEENKNTLKAIEAEMEKMSDEHKKKDVTIKNLETENEVLKGALKEMEQENVEIRAKFEQLKKMILNV